MRNALLAVLVTCFLLSVTFLFVENKEKYLSTDFWARYPQLKTTYYSSQYADPNHTEWISDDVANSFAGGALITGTNPVLVLSDTPPLGKYLIGLSALLFDNENIVVLAAGIGSLIMLYMIGMQIFQSRILALLPPLLVSFESLFRAQFRVVPLYDLFQLFFLLTSFYFFNIAILGKRRIYGYFALASMVLGCFIATKFFATGITIVLAWYTIVLRTDKKRILPLTIALPLAIAVLFLSYARIFAFGYDVRSLFGIQKYVFLYHKSQLILPFTIWPLLFLNRWYVWWGSEPFISDIHWSITWPMITTIALGTAVLYVLRKIPTSRPLEVILLWSLFYLLFSSAGQINSRYLIILLPSLYVVSLYGIIHIGPLIIPFVKKIMARKLSKS